MVVIKEPISFQWDRGNIGKNEKSHEVTEKEAEETFFDKKKVIYKDKFQGDIVDYVLKHFADGVHMHKDFITLDLVNKLYVKELNIGVYTVNDMQIMKKFIRWNIDFLFTDYPDKAYVVLGKI